MVEMNRGELAARMLAMVGSAALLLSACGGSSSSSNSSGVSTVDAISRAAYVSGSQTGYKMRMSMQVGAAGQTALSASGTGTFNVPQRTGTMNLSMSLPVATAGAGRLSMDEIITPDTLYMRLPAALTSRLPGGKPWISMSVHQLGKAAGIPGLSSFMNGSTGNPSNYLQYLKGASSTKVHSLGPGYDNGVSTQGYGALLDLTKATNRLPSGERAQAHRAIAALEKMTGLHYIPVSVWVDSHHLVRRMTMSFNERVPGTAQSLNVSMQMDFLDYGPQPAPGIPPASEVNNLLSLLHGGLGSIASGA
jgi:hypothetical protein